MCFLGITINSEKMELSLPQAKVDKLHNAIDECMGRRFVSKKTLQKIGGLNVVLFTGCKRW